MTERTVAGIEDSPLAASAAVSTTPLTSARAVATVASSRQSPMRTSKSEPWEWHFELAPLVMVLAPWFLVVVATKWFLEASK